MVLALGAALQHSQGAAGIERGLGHQFQESRFAHVMRAGTGDQNSSRTQQTEGSEVDFFIARGGRFDVLAGFGEGRRVEDYEVEMAAFGGIA